MSEPRTGLRRLCPPNGQAYELWDCAMLLFLIAVVGYLFTEPTSAARGSLVFQVDSNPRTWGLGLALFSGVGVICSYVGRWLRAGYVLTITAASFWTLSFLIGVLFLNAPVRGLVSVLIYGWITRRLVREGFSG